MKMRWGWFLVGFLPMTFLWLLLLSCCQTPQQVAGKPVEPVITITVKNDTDHPFYGVLGAGPMSRSITVPAHEERGFWGYKSMLPDALRIVVVGEEPKPARRK